MFVSVHHVQRGETHRGVFGEVGLFGDELAHRGGSAEQRGGVYAERRGGDEPRRAEHGVASADGCRELHDAAVGVFREGAEDSLLRVCDYEDVLVALAFFEHFVAVPEELRHRLGGRAGLADADEGHSAALHALPYRARLVRVGVVGEVELRLRFGLVVESVEQRLVEHKVAERGAAYADLYHAVVAAQPLCGLGYLCGGTIRQSHPSVALRVEGRLVDPTLRLKRRRFVLRAERARIKGALAERRAEGE